MTAWDYLWEPQRVSAFVAGAVAKLLHDGCDYDEAFAAYRRRFNADRTEARVLVTDSTSAIFIQAPVGNAHGWHIEMWTSGASFPNEVLLFADAIARNGSKAVMAAKPEPQQAGFMPELFRIAGEIESNHLYFNRYAQGYEGRAIKWVEKGAEQTGIIHRIRIDLRDSEMDRMLRTVSESIMVDIRHDTTGKVHSIPLRETITLW